MSKKFYIELLEAEVTRLRAELEVLKDKLDPLRNQKTVERHGEQDAD